MKHAFESLLGGDQFIYRRRRYLKLSQITDGVFNAVATRNGSLAAIPPGAPVWRSVVVAMCGQPGNGMSTPCNDLAAASIFFARNAARYGGQMPVQIMLGRLTLHGTYTAKRDTARR
jgi:hypothetical protein